MCRRSQPVRLLELRHNLHLRKTQLARFSMATEAAGEEELVDYEEEEETLAEAPKAGAETTKKYASCTKHFLQ